MQVYNKNLINVDGSNISLQLRKRRESARHMRQALLQEDPAVRRRTTTSAGLDLRDPAADPAALLLTTAETDAMVSRVQPQDRPDVGLLLERHKELRRKKSASSIRRNGSSVSREGSSGRRDSGSVRREGSGRSASSARREGVVQRPGGGGELPPIGQIEEGEEGSTNL